MSTMRSIIIAMRCTKLLRVAIYASTSRTVFHRPIVVAGADLHLHAEQRRQHVAVDMDQRSSNTSSRRLK